MVPFLTHLFEAYLVAVGLLSLFLIARGLR